MSENDIEILNSIVKVNKDFLYDIENQTINQKEIKALENLLLDYKKQKQINKEQQRENEKLKIARIENDYGYENIHFITEKNLIRIDKNKYFIEIEDGNFVDLKEVYLENKNNISKKAIKDILENIQLLYEENLKSINLKEVENIDKKIFEGIQLEAKRDLLQELIRWCDYGTKNM